ncbi:MAG: IS110 family transposase [Planctomycetes bacterium]|jgi:transposase|nr:IS110 family transposase [Planctomycetota bacterium]
MTEPKSYRRFCGIDVGKNTHTLCLIDAQQNTLVPARSFHNDHRGFQQLLTALQETGRKPTVLVGMEATGPYWYSLHHTLTQQGYTVTVLNPIQTARQARREIRKRKTDKLDAHRIAVLLQNGRYRSALIPGELAMTCRLVTRLRYRLVRQQTRLKQLVQAQLHPVWPEYEALFVDPFSVTSRKLLAQSPVPADLLKWDEERLREFLRRTSRGKHGPQLAENLRQAAEESVGMQRGLPGTRLALQILLEQMENAEPLLQKLQEQTEALARQVPTYLKTLPGSTTLSMVSLYGEVDPIATFQASSQLVAFAGLDPQVYQSGEYDAPRRHISKRGSPFLRRTIWQMAYRAVYQEGDLRQYWLRKRAQQTHHLAAVTAVAGKLCHIIWRIMTDQRDYVPDRRPSQS